MTTKEANEYISHLQKYGDGSSVLNVFDVFNTKPITLNELHKLYFEKATGVYPKNAGTEEKN